MTNKVHLLPCPWNSNHDNRDHERYVQRDDYGYSVMCSWCESTGQTKSTKEEAIESWNDRRELNKTEEYERGYYECKKQFLELIKEKLNT